MSLNQVLEDGDDIFVAVPAGTVSGAPVIIGGGLTGVAQDSRSAEGKATITRKGSFKLTVTAATAIVVGTPIYIPTAGGALTSAAAGGVKFGIALGVLASGTGVIEVALSKG